MEKEHKYKGHTITVKFPSGMFEYYSDKQGRFLKFDTLKAAKESITDESKKGKSVNESVKKITLSELKGIVRKLVMEQKSEYNEISDELFTNTLSKTREKGLHGQRNRIVKSRLHKYIGYVLPGKDKVVIDDINISDNILRITFSLLDSGTEHIEYDIDTDSFDFEPEKTLIPRSFAVVLSKIAKKVNPTTKYTTPHSFKIKEKYSY